MRITNTRATIKGAVKGMTTSKTEIIAKIIITTLTSGIIEVTIIIIIIIMQIQIMRTIIGQIIRVITITLVIITIIRDGRKIITTTPTDPRTRVETTNPNNTGGPIMPRPTVNREEGGTIQGAVASTDTMTRSTSAKTGEIQEAGNEGAGVLKATAETTIIGPKFISYQTMTRITMGDGPIWRRGVR